MLSTLVSVGPLRVLWARSTSKILVAQTDELGAVRCKSLCQSSPFVGPGTVSHSALRRSASLLAHNRTCAIAHKSKSPHGVPLSTLLHHDARARRRCRCDHQQPPAGDQCPRVRRSARVDVPQGHNVSIRVDRPVLAALGRRLLESLDLRDGLQGEGLHDAALLHRGQRCALRQDRPECDGQGHPVRQHGRVLTSDRAPGTPTH